MDWLLIKDIKQGIETASNGYDYFLKNSDKVFYKELMDQYKTIDVLKKYLKENF